ncbi:MAG: type II toxin-antitoxin system HicB family antitoxin [Eubacterium sp.]|nr:type II toxin-antitoxin system HicB family antitoxin [Eubacterium sp.]MCM1214857.1 type II toxin-antitoxin system HicB family antitoxin [Lachnospiraceae bacterium]MCM1303484.1 type II toxin-antitoxin system HicB family antitoxin [Butyrivibrio sp.]MCM1342752.1 type II toxin-antitoxin system HicB family antitoxin [Muribaculaceae bacterium]MCM1238933.1 type II toxin-antitoxin system HicB family antitoxin [Lachnospiraceae bacterium]
MAKYAYPAVFTKEDNGQYSVVFRDLEGCYTCGNNIEHAIEMAEDALALVLYGYETERKEIPAPSPRDTIELRPGEFINDIRCDTLEYRKMYNNRSVRKNVTLPEWLNEEAEALRINFSQVLQDALMQKLGI